MRSWVPASWSLLNTATRNSLRTSSVSFSSMHVLGLGGELAHRAG